MKIQSGGPETRFRWYWFFPLPTAIWVLSEHTGLGHPALSCGLAVAQAWLASLLSGFLAHRLVFPEIVSGRNAVSIILSAYCLLFIAMVTGKFYAMSYEMMDLGNMDQALYSTLHGDILHSTGIGTGLNRSRFAGHFEPVLVPLSPLLLLANNPLPLLWFQVLITGAGIPAVYLLGREITGDRTAALSFTGAFALYPALNYSTLFAFHGDTLAITPLLFMIYFALRRRYTAMYLCMAAAVSCKEYVALVTAAFGCWLMLGRRERIRGSVCMVSSLAYFIAVFFFAMPLFNDGKTTAQLASNFGNLGGAGGPGGMAAEFFVRPLGFVSAVATVANFENVLWLLLPLGFLSMAGTGILCAGVPVLVKDLLAGLDIFNHRSDTLIPFIFTAAMYGFVRVRNRLPRSRRRSSINAYFLTSALLAALWLGPTPLGNKFWRLLPEYIPDSHDAVAREALRLIPEKAPVSCSGHLAPHLTHREKVFIFPLPADPDEARYVIVDTLEQRFYNWCPEAQARAGVEKMRNSRSWINIFSRDGILVYERTGGREEGTFLGVSAHRKSVRARE